MPLTNAVLHSMPPDRSGVASALLNASREVAGLLGITVIGAVLRSRQGDALRHGAAPAHAFLDGYHAGLIVTVALIAAGAVVSYFTLRHIPRQAEGVVPGIAAELSGSAEPDLAEQPGTPVGRRDAPRRGRSPIGVAHQSGNGAASADLSGQLMRPRSADPAGASVGC